MTRTITLTAAGHSQPSCTTCKDAGYLMRTDRDGFKFPTLCPDCTPKEAKPRKYRNEPTTVDSIRFDSKAEADRWGELVAMTCSHSRWHGSQPYEIQPKRRVVLWTCVMCRQEEVRPEVVYTPAPGGGGRERIVKEEGKR